MDHRLFEPLRRAAAAAIAAAALVVGAAASARAQGTGAIAGRITEVGSGAPVGDVQVVVQGTALGGVTAADGRYRITAVPAGTHTLRVRRIGFNPATRTVTVAAAQTAAVDVAIATSATQLEALVVTGTAGAQEKRTVGNAVTQLNVADITDKASVMDVTEVLQSRTPGVTILPGSGVPGAAADIRIRGTASLSGYKPVVYIDGIRYNIEGLGNFNPTGSGLAGQAQSSQATSALDFLDPNDIESLEVIKGPAAATLYGADAAGGVIQIITKKGTRGQQPLRWNVKVEKGNTDWALPTPVNYTTCDPAKKAQVSGGAPVWPGCQGVVDYAVITGNPLRDDPNALRTGNLTRLNLALRGGGDRYSFYISGARDDEQGVFFNSYNNRKSGRANFTVNPSDKADLNLSLGYINTQLRLPYQDESANSLLLSGARGLPGRISNAGEGWRTINPLQSNRYNNRTNADRFTLGGTLNYNPIRWMRNRFTGGIDLTSSLAQLQAEPGSVEDVTGFTAQRVPRTHLYTLDYAGSVDLPVTARLQSTTSFGAQVIARRDENISATGTGLGAPDVTLVGTAAVTSGSNSFSENNSVGYYGQEQIGWNNRLFLTGALRVDNNSSFGTDFNLITYPKLSLSWVLSEEPAVRRLFETLHTDNFRLRAAWGQAGRAPAPYSATQTYTVDKVTLSPTSTGSALRTSAYGNPGLKPERGTEIEVGFDADFFRQRLGAEVTYYNKSMRDMLLSVPLPPSLGFGGSQLRNLGEVTNSGIEAAITASPIQSRTVAWESRLNLSTNHNNLVTFGIPNTTAQTPGGQAYGAVQQHRVGYPLGGFWAAFPLRNPDGTPQLRSSGSVILDTATYIGPSTPTREAGFSNTVTLFKYVRLYALLDYKGGFYVFNLKERNRCQTANSNCARVNDPRVVGPQTAADSLLAKELPVWQQVPAVYVERADFVKLRDVSLTVQLPRSLLSRTGADAASLTFAGHNLKLWSDYTGLDPEVNTYGGRNFVRVDAYASPMMRRLSVVLNLTY